MKLIILLVLLLANAVKVCSAGETVLTVSYPYSLDNRQQLETFGPATRPLYVNIESSNNEGVRKAKLKIFLPADIEPEESPFWTFAAAEEGTVLIRSLELPPDYGNIFDLIYLKTTPALKPGKKQIKVRLEKDDGREEKSIEFRHNEAFSDLQQQKLPELKASEAGFNWYIQSLTLPVDNLGNKDYRFQDNTILIRDAGVESFRNRMTGKGTANWSVVFNHPATYVLLEMRNPQLDTRVLRFKAELADKLTGDVVPGLCRSGESDEESGQCWSDDDGGGFASTALLSLDGIKNQSFVLPIYADHFKLLAGEYNLRITVEGGGQSKAYETPVKMVRQRSLGLFSVGFSLVSLFFLLINLGRLKQCVLTLGAKGAITVSLFAAVAFGGIVLPSTILGDFLHVLLGPFSGLVTGILNGVLLYLLLAALITLYRCPGVAALFFLLKWMLAALIFGKFSPIGILSFAVYILVVELVLYLAGFYRLKELSPRYVLFCALAIGCADAFITMVNLEQMMFFYRLYYADWYIFLYMLVNGLIYSTIGCILGYRVGCKLQQVMGE